MPIFSQIVHQPQPLPHESERTGAGGMPLEVDDSAMTDGTLEMADEVVLTPEGFRRVREELEQLKTVQRKQVADRIREAKQLGDFIDNSEYENAKAAQAQVEGRILELQRLLLHARVVEGPLADSKEVGVGSLVRLQEVERGEECEYRIVGAAEADPSQARISNLSPVGRALMGQEVGAQVKVETPMGTTLYRILRVDNSGG